MNKRPARNAVEAWEKLREMGGLELNGRDSGLEDELRRALNKEAQTLRDALEGCSTTELVRALLETTVQPYVAMFRDILEFFKAAGVREGREQWQIQLDEEIIELKNFEEFLETWHLVHCEFEVPAIDFIGAFSLIKATHVLAGTNTLDGRKTGFETGIVDVEDWFDTFAQGIYLPLPASLLQQGAPELADAIALIQASLATIRKAWPDRATMLEEHKARHYRCDKANGLDPTTIAQNETDYCLRNSIYCTATFTRLDPNDRKAVADDLTYRLSKYPRRKVSVSAPQTVLEKILSFPVWRRRHELYAVWIATEIIAALNSHESRLHSEEGRIQFAFRKTLIATVETSRPTVRLYAERRTPLEDPVGHGRTANVQPDYTLWRGLGSTEQCGLVIEVKHYLKNSPARFREVLQDYARAHPAARVVLVNHGPGLEPAAKSEAMGSDRCAIIGELTAFNLEKRHALRSLVREYVGDPCVGATRDRVGTRALVVDTSASMESVLASQDFLHVIMSSAAGTSDEVILIDCEIRARCRLDEFSRVASSIGLGSTTKLREPIRALLMEFETVLVFTDSDGTQSLSAFDFDVVAVHDCGGAVVEVVELRR